MLDTIASHLETLQLDIRMSKNARYFDQKTKTDVVELLARCIIEMVRDDEYKKFTNNDIWKMDFFIKESSNYFNKPPANNPKAANEYDKFISQPMCLFANSGLLSSTKSARTRTYQCQNKKLLEYISQRPQYAGIFLAEYYERIFRNSGLGTLLDNFLNFQNKQTLTNLKDGFYQLLYQYTPIGKRCAQGINPGKTESNRIFNPALNVICSKYRKYGTEHGRIADHIIRYDELQYNRINFRDVSKEKEKTRKEAETDPVQLQRHEKYLASQETRAKKLIKHLYKDKPMYLDGSHVSPVMEIHHIILRSQKPAFAGYVENLINLSPTQHKGYAHRSNDQVRTDEADPQYQRRLMIANSFYIEKSLERKQHYYSKPQLIDLLLYGMEIQEATERQSFRKLRENICGNYLDVSEIQTIEKQINGELMATP